MNRFEKDIDCLWQYLEEKEIFTKEEIENQLKDKYFLGRLPNNMLLEELALEEVYIENHNISYILSKHYKQFTKEEFKYILEVIADFDFLSYDEKNTEARILIKNFSKNRYVDIVIMKKSSHMVIHFTVRNEKKIFKKIKKLESLNKILLNKLN